MNQPAFWDDSLNSNKIMQELKSLKSTVDPFEKGLKKINDLKELTEISSDDPEFLKQIEQELSVLRSEEHTSELQSQR